MYNRQIWRIALPGFILFTGLFIGTVSGDGATGSVEGTVRDSGSGRIVGGAKVSLRIGLLTMSSMTDTIGTFVFTGIPPATELPITVTHPAYMDTVYLVTVHAGKTADASIVIESIYLRLAYPNGGEKIFAGSEIPISWVSVGIKTVGLEFSFNSGRDWQVIVPETDASTGYYTWDVPDIPSTEYLIRITDTADDRLHDMSDRLFSKSST